MFASGASLRSRSPPCGFGMPSWRLKSVNVATFQTLRSSQTSPSCSATWSSSMRSASTSRQCRWWTCSTRSTLSSTRWAKSTMFTRWVGRGGGHSQGWLWVYWSSGGLGWPSRSEERLGSLSLCVAAGGDNSWRLHGGGRRPQQDHFPRPPHLRHGPGHAELHRPPQGPVYRGQHPNQSRWAEIRGSTVGCPQKSLNDVITSFCFLIHYILVTILKEITRGFWILNTH